MRIAVQIGVTEYDLRLKFPFSDKGFKVSDEMWTCRLAEVSDLRPEADRLSWYLVFEPAEEHRRAQPIRKLEIVTSAAQVIAAGWPPEAEARIEEWLQSNEQDGRVEWLQDGK